MATFPKQMEKMKAEFADRPQVHPMSLPRSKMPLLMESIKQTPMGVGGSALRGLEHARASATVTAASLCGATLVRTAMAQHRARMLEKKHKALSPATPGWCEEMAGKAVYHDDQLVILADKYPKSAFHFLVVPRDWQRLRSLNDLERRDLTLLRRMRDAGTAVATAIQSSDCDVDEIRAFDEHYGIFTPDPPHEAELQRLRAEHAYLAKDSVFDRTRPLALEAPSGLITLPTTRVKFLQGFHSMPSLAPLHMHVISLDLLSACLKHKKHYNSFTTKFFLASKAVEEDLAQWGNVRINQDIHIFEFEERRRLECVWCGLSCENIGKLKRHLPVCHKNEAMIR